MSVKNIYITHLSCDSCGVVKQFGTTDGTAARIAAAAEGWTYRSYAISGGKRGGARRAIRDACPKCELPEEITPSAAPERAASG